MKKDMKYVMKAFVKLDIPFHLLGKSEHDIKRISSTWGGLDFVPIESFSKGFFDFKADAFAYYFPNALINLDHLEEVIQNIPKDFNDYYFDKSDTAKEIERKNLFLANRNPATFDYLKEALATLNYQNQRMLQNCSVISYYAVRLIEKIESKCEVDLNNASPFRYPSIINFAFNMWLHSSVHKYDIRVVKNSRIGVTRANAYRPRKLSFSSKFNHGSHGSICFRILV